MLSSTAASTSAPLAPAARSASPATLVAERVRERRKRHHADDLDTESLHAYLDDERRSVHRVADALAREGAEVLRLVTSDTSVQEQVALVREALDDRSRHPADSAG